MTGKQSKEANVLEYAYNSLGKNYSQELYNIIERHEIEIHIRESATINSKKNRKTDLESEIREAMKEVFSYNYKEDRDVATLGQRLCHAIDQQPHSGASIGPTINRFVRLVGENRYDSKCFHDQIIKLTHPKKIEKFVSTYINNLRKEGLTKKIRENPVSVAKYNIINYIELFTQDDETRKIKSRYSSALEKYQKR